MVANAGWIHFPRGRGWHAFGAQYCDARRAGCFATAALTTDLGESSPSCAGVGASAFAIVPGLDASTDAGANVSPAEVWRYFSQRPTGVPAF